MEENLKRRGAENAEGGKFGPVDTDKILLRALNSAADLPAAIEFPPKKRM